MILFRSNDFSIEKLQATSPVSSSTTPFQSQFRMMGYIFTLYASISVTTHTPPTTQTMKFGILFYQPIFLVENLGLLSGI